MISARPPIADERQAAADRLAHRGEVGRDAEAGLRAAVRDREGDDLVEDQHDAEPLGDVAQSLKELSGGRDHPGGAHDRLDDDGGDVIRLALEDLLGAVGVVERELDERPRARSACTPAGAVSAGRRSSSLPTTSTSAMPW